MKKQSSTPSVEKGIIISTTGYPKNSHARQEVIAWNKGSEQIVGMIETVINKTSTQTTVSKQTPFIPQYIFSYSDEGSMLDPKRPPMKLWDSASQYQDWIMDNCKGAIPDFKTVVENLCQGRFVLFIGLGGYIFCEFNDDATALIQYYQD